MAIRPYSEGTNPIDRRIITYASNSMDTSAIDAFRQGIELTQDKHFQQGIVKIWSGIDGHVVEINDIGQRDDDIFPDTTYYEEVAKFDPVLYLTDYFSEQVIVIDSAVNVNENGFDGIIEPFPIRRVVSFTSIDVPFEARSVKGNLESGNHDSFRNADLVINEVRFSEKSIGIHSYEDNVDMTGRVPTNLGFWPTISTRLNGFDDSQVRDGVMIPTRATEVFKESLKSMTPSTLNYLPQDYYSTAASLHDRTFDYYIPQKTNFYDPTRLNFTGWWRANYSSLPWSGTTSSGNSHLHILDAGTAPSVGTSINSWAPASFSSASSQYASDTTNSALAYISRTSYSIVMLAKPTNPQSPAGSVYSNPSLIGDSSGNYGIAFSTSGAKAYHASGGYYETEWLPCNSGEWHFFAVVYNGSTLNFYVDGFRSVAKGVPTLSTPGNFRVARGLTTTYADVDVAEVMVSKVAYSITDLETILERYMNIRYNLSL